MDEATRSQAKSLEEIKDLLLGFQNDVLMNIRSWEIAYHWVKILGEIFLENPLILTRKRLEEMVLNLKETKVELKLDFKDFEEISWGQPLRNDNFLMESNLNGRLKNINVTTEINKKIKKELLNLGS